MNEQGADKNDEVWKNNDGYIPNINGFPFTICNTSKPARTVLTTNRLEAKLSH